MEHATSWLHGSLIYLTAAVLAVPLSRLLGLGSIIGDLAAGMPIGPWCASISRTSHWSPGRATIERNDAGNRSPRRSRYVNPSHSSLQPVNAMPV